MTCEELKTDIGVEKVEAVFFKVGKPFPFVPFIAHSYYVHNLCLRVKKDFGELGCLIILFNVCPSGGRVNPRPY